jgi:hypothetical protein
MNEQMTYIAGNCCMCNKQVLGTDNYCTNVITNRILCPDCIKLIDNARLTKQQRELESQQSFEKWLKGVVNA